MGKEDLQTENFGAGLRSKTLSNPSHPPFLLLNRKTTGFRNSLGNIQSTYRAGTLWVLLKKCVRRRGTNTAV